MCDFFCNLALFLKKMRNERAETYLLDLAPLSRASAHGATNEGVTPCALA
jgi:hypothetical protein